MIFGIGTDLVSTDRIDRLYSLYPTQFPIKILSQGELSKFQQSKNKIHFLAKKFAAKEALVKAIGTGFRNGITFQDISILNDELGKPYFILNNNIKAIIGNRFNIHLSLSDEKKFVVAFVVIEK